MPMIGMHHHWFPGRPPSGHHHKHNPNGLEATWILSVAVVGLAITLPIVVAILKSCDYRRPTILLIFNMSLVDTLLCLLYMPIYIIYVLLNPVVQPTAWFCLHAQALFRMGLGSKLTTFAFFATKMFQNVYFGRKNERSLMSSFRIILMIFGTWAAYFVLYHPSIFSSKLGIISDVVSDGVCVNITNLHITGKGNEESIVVASIVGIVHWFQLVLTCFTLLAVFYSISNTSHSKFENADNYTETQKVTYVKAGRSTAVLILVLLFSWIPLLTIDTLLAMEYVVPKQAVHFALHCCFMSPIGTWITMLFAIRSLRMDVGRCCAWVCCYKPPVLEVEGPRRSGSESDSWMGGDRTTSSGHI